MNKSIAITEARLEELPELSRFAREVWHETYDPLLPDGQVDYMVDQYQSAQVIERDLTENGYRYYLARRDGRLAGYCGIRPDPEQNTIFLSKIYVHPSARRQGLARRFVETFLAEYPGYDAVWLTVNRGNERAISSYKRLGFAISRQQRTDIGNGYVMDDYIMTKPLK